VTRWAQAPRASWDEAGLAPQLLVLWSIEQNELIPLHDWLRDLDARYGKLGLRIVSIASPNDDGKLDAYLKSHPFPGSVGVDRREGTGLGLTQKRFFIERFNLPRLLLLDIDGKVAWEGDPGFKIGDVWATGGESYLDAPLAELVKTRKLDVLREWLDGWISSGAAELAAGDLAKAWPRLVVARELDGRIVPQVVDVQRKLAVLEAVFADLPKEGARLEKEGRAAALRDLVAWAKLTGVEPDKALATKLKPYLEGSQAAQWRRCSRPSRRASPRTRASAPSSRRSWKRSRVCSQPSSPPMCARRAAIPRSSPRSSPRRPGAPPAGWRGSASAGEPSQRRKCPTAARRSSDMRDTSFETSSEWDAPLEVPFAAVATCSMFAVIAALELVAPDKFWLMSRVIAVCSSTAAAMVVCRLSISRMIVPMREIASTAPREPD
jgi:hypothetical protein